LRWAIIAAQHKAFSGQQRLSISSSRHSVGAYMTLGIDLEQFSSNDHA
jgi:hypothetical protein